MQHGSSQQPALAVPQFEELCAKLLEFEGYAVKRKASVRNPISTAEVDMIASRAGKRWLVDLKYAPSAQVSLSQLRELAASAALLNAYPHFGETLLIVSGEIEPARRDWAEREFRIKIWDRQHLIGIAQNAPIEPQLAAFFKRGAEAEVTARKPRSEELTAKLKEIKPGREGARAHGALCLEIIDFLCGETLVEPRASHRLEDGLDIAHIAFRVKSLHQFWTALTRDFRARAVIFECRNHDGPIGPSQVQSTARLLSVAAMRPLCFVLGREPPHEHAELAAFGLLRDAGKLLVFLSDDDIAHMLRLKDAQLAEAHNSKGWIENDPTIALDQKIYDLIARLPG